MESNKYRFTPFEVPTHVTLNLPPGVMLTGPIGEPVRIGHLRREKLMELCQEWERAVWEQWKAENPQED